MTKTCENLLGTLQLWARKYLTAKVVNINFYIIPHREVNKATDAWSTHHGSTPLQKETQSAWDGAIT